MSEPGKPPDFSNLTENLTQQQAKISALKELVRQSESQHGKNTASVHEKVKNIAQRLSNLKSKTTKSRHRSNSDLSEEHGISYIEEEELQLPETIDNAPSNSSSQRARSETPGSEKITLLRKQMEVNRAKMAERESKSKEIEQMVTELKSKFETSQLSLEKSLELGRSMGDLSSIPTAPLHSQSFSDVSQTSRSFSLENERIKFLEKRIREHEATLSKSRNLTESDKVQKLERKILDLEENLREKESVIDARTKAVSLLSENLTKKKKDVVDSLEDTKQEMFKMQETFLEAESSYKDEVDRLNRVINERNDEIQNLNEKCEILEKSRYDLTIENSELKTKLEDVQDYSTKISELNKLNETLQKQISNLESQRYEFITQEEVGEANLEGNKDTRSELLEKIKSLEQLLESRNNEYEQLEEKLQEKTVELDVVNANFSVIQEKYNSLTPKSLFPPDSNADDEAPAEIIKLKQQLDDSNKNMIKTKLKIKNLQKQVDSFKKADTTSEVAKLTEEIQILTQRIAELEEDKINNQWQEWGAETELEKKIKILEETCQNQTTAIQLLEEQKMDMSEDLQNAKHRQETVKDYSEVEARLIILEKLNVDLEQEVHQLTAEKAAVENKLTRYASENIELHDKIDKLSKGSSAESIEMVNLTAQDNEEYQKALGGDDAGPEISQELNESLRSLREESSELMSKIELFTIERREVLDKLEVLTDENQALVSTIELVRQEKVDLKHENESLKESLERTEKILSELQTDKEQLSKNAAELSENRLILQDEINSLVKESLQGLDEAATGSETVSSSIDKEACEKLLKQLDAEIQNLCKSKDKHQKLKASKKLSDSAKNVHAMMANLLVEYYKTLDNCKQLRDDLGQQKLSLSSTSTDDKLSAVQIKLENLQKLNEVKDGDIVTLQEAIQTVNADLKSKEELAAKLQQMVETLTEERDHYEVELQSQRSLVDDLRKELDQLCVDVRVNNQCLNEKSSELDKLQREFDMRLKTSTNEVEILKTLVAEQKQLLIDSYQEHELDINLKVKEINDYQNHVEQMKGELNTLKELNSSNQESYVHDINAEVAQLKNLLNENNQLLVDYKEELLHKQETIDTLNNQIIDLYKTMEENANKIIKKEDELQYLQELHETSREEIQDLQQQVSENHKIISDLQNQLSARGHESEMLQQKALAVSSDSPREDNRVTELEKEVKALEAKNKEQHDKLKKFAANLKKKQAQCTELEEKLAGNTDVADAELNKLRQKIDQCEDVISQNLNEIKDLQDKLQVSLQKHDQMEESLINYKAQIHTLHSENTKLTETVNTFEKEGDELTAKVEEQESKDKTADKKKMDKLKAAVVQLKQKLANKRIEAEDLTKQLNLLRSSAAESRPQEAEAFNIRLQEMSSKILDETKNAYEHDIGILKQQLADLVASNSLLNEDKQRKASLEGQLETFEMINAQLRDRIATLEESVASSESEKNSLLLERLSLATELEEKDAQISQKLRDAESDNFQLTETIKELTSQKDTLLQKLTVIETQSSSHFDKMTQRISDLENDNSRLHQQVEQLQSDLKKAYSAHEQALNAKHSEIDEMEADLSSQLQKIESEKKTIQEALEKANDQIVDFEDELERMKANTYSLEQSRTDLEREILYLKLQNESYTQDQLENEQLRMQLMQSETETENLRSQSENLHENHNVETMILRQQIADLEAMTSQVGQNQTDDQVMLQNENVKLKELLIQKESEVQHKTIQLQMVSTFDSPIQAANDPFANLIDVPSQASLTQSHQEIKSLEDKLKQTEAENAKLRESCLIEKMEIEMQATKIQELFHENDNINKKMGKMQLTVDDLTRRNIEMEASLLRKQQENPTEPLHGTVNKYETATPSATGALFNPAPIPKASTLFSDETQDSAASLFDDDLQGVQQQEVIEEIIRPKKAYLCYDKTSIAETQTDDDWLKNHEETEIQLQQLREYIRTMDQKLVEQAAELENQAENLNSYKRRISELESSEQPQQSSTVMAQYFNPPPAFQSTTPLTFDQSHSMAALEIEDGWGWGSSDGSEIQQQASLLSPRSDLQVRLQEQQDKVERMEKEKNLLNEELSNMRESSKKMMKKLKEYQTKIKDLEQKTLRKSFSVESNDMDLVIQEELNSQVQKLEARLKDINTEQEKEQQEKKTLMKRIDVLTAANERMIEAKERQDNQMDMYQLRIRDLDQKLHNLEEWGADDKKKDLQPTQTPPMQENQSELHKTIQELNDHIKDMQVDFDEVQALLSEEKANNKILEEKLITLIAQSPKDEEIEKLSRLLKESSEQQKLLTQEIDRKDQEIRDLISKIDLLSNESSNIKTILDDLSTQIQLKTNENQELNQRLQNLASSNEELSRERQIYNDSIEQNFRQYSHDLEQQLQTMHAELQYKISQNNQLNDKISELTLEINQTQLLISSASSNEQELMTLRTRLQELEKQQSLQPVLAEEGEDLQQRVLNLERINSKLVQENVQMEEELKVLNDQVLLSLEFEHRTKNAVLELDAKNIEIQMLKASLENLQQIQTNEKSTEAKNDLLVEIEKLQHEKRELEQSMKSSIDLLNAQWSQAVEQRGNEVANSWKQHLEARESEFAELETSLRNQLGKESEEASGEDQNEKSIDTIAKMRSIMESQEVEIVSLKEQLAIRSAEYASLSAKVDPYHQMSTSMNVSPVPADSDKVPRSELDLALYMLHQREMRLEEMTMELVRLLDERDQLQLRLSNSIRQTEEVKRKHNICQDAELSDISKTTTPEKSASTAATAEFGEDEQLRAKLSELNTIRHVKDKAIQDEREQRFQENIAMLQRDVVNIPHQAAARIVASSSDQGQSPSSVLMNWFLGKNPESS